MARSPSPASQNETVANGYWRPSDSGAATRSRARQQGYEEGTTQGKGNTIYWWFDAPAPFVPTPSELRELARRFAVFKKIAEADRADYQEGFYQGYGDGYKDTHTNAF
jgi:flagellar biosynthesis/type III secretory pathway protein FliH